jgi:hypothetical protein
MGKSGWLGLLALAAGVSAATAGSREPAVVVVDGLVVGQFRSGKWSAAGMNLISAARRYRLTGIGVGKLVGTPPRTARLLESEGNGAIVTAEPLRGVFLSGARASFRAVNPAPGALERHRSAVTAALRGRGLGAPVLRSAHRVDLDGDGRAETVLAVSSRAGLRLGGQVRPGDYSALFVVPGRGAARLTPAFIGSYQDEGGTDLWFSEVRAIADLDGDRKPEVVLGTGYHLGPGGAILGYRGGRTRVLAQAMNDEP